MTKKQNFEGMVQKALFDFNMISAGDILAVGVSGGKDSLALLLALSRIREYSPEAFDLKAITLDLGIGETDHTKTQELCKSIGVPYHIEETKIGKIVFDIRKEENPCSLCANLRRGALNNKAVSLGCNKAALGHHRDDVVETMLMSLFQEGRFHSFSPVTYLSRKNIHVIRPMVYVKENDIREYVKRNQLFPVKNPCPANDDTKRIEIREMLNQMEKENPVIRQLLFGAVKRSYLSGWQKNCGSESNPQNPPENVQT